MASFRLALSRVILLYQFVILLHHGGQSMCNATHPMQQVKDIYHLASIFWRKGNLPHITMFEKVLFIMIVRYFTISE